MANWRSQAEQRYKEKLAQGSFKLSEGDNCLRVIPNKKSVDLPPFVEYFVHNDVGPDKKRVRCGRKMIAGGNADASPCWMCDTLIPKLDASGNKAKKIIAESIQRKEQFAIQVAVLDSQTGKFRGPYLWHVSTGGRKSLATKLLGVLRNPRKDCVDPVKGYNINIERTGQSMQTTYGAPEIDNEPTQVPAAILAASKFFKDLLMQYDPEKQKAAFYGKTEEEATATEEEAPADDAEETTDNVASGEESGEEATDYAGDGEGDDAPAEEEQPRKPAAGKKPAPRRATQVEEAESDDNAGEQVDEDLTDDLPPADDDGDLAPEGADEEPLPDDDGAESGFDGEGGDGESAEEPEPEERPKPRQKPAPPQQRKPAPAPARKPAPAPAPARRPAAAPPQAGKKPAGKR